MALRRARDPRIIEDARTGETFVLEHVLKRQDEVLAQYDPGKKKNGRYPKYVQVRNSRTVINKLKALTSEQRGFFMQLTLFAGWESNILFGVDEIVGRTGEPLTWAEIGAYWGVERHKRAEIVKALEEKRFIGYLLVAGKKRGIVINPMFALYGKRPASETKAVFMSMKDIDADEADFDYESECDE